MLSITAFSWVLHMALSTCKCITIYGISCEQGTLVSWQVTSCGVHVISTDVIALNVTAF